MIARARAVLTQITIRHLPRAAELLLPVVALASSVPRRVRRAAGRRPRLLWGPMPIISIKYWSAAARERGYTSSTHVDHFYAINSRSDFDSHSDEFLGESPLAQLARPYVVFARLLWRGDVVLSFLDGGFLRATHLRDGEGTAAEARRDQARLLPVRHRHRGARPHRRRRGAPPSRLPRLHRDRRPDPQPGRVVLPVGRRRDPQLPVRLPAALGRRLADDARDRHGRLEQRRARARARTAATARSSCSTPPTTGT